MFLAQRQFSLSKVMKKSIFNPVIFSLSYLRVPQPLIYLCGSISSISIYGCQHTQYGSQLTIFPFFKIPNLCFFLSFIPSCTLAFSVGPFPHLHIWKSIHPFPYPLIPNPVFVLVSESRHQRLVIVCVQCGLKTNACDPYNKCDNQTLPLQPLDHCVCVEECGYITVSQPQLVQQLINNARSEFLT